MECGTVIVHVGGGCDMAFLENDGYYLAAGYVLIVGFDITFPTEAAGPSWHACSNIQSEKRQMIKFTAKKDISGMTLDNHMKGLILRAQSNGFRNQWILQGLGMPGHGTCPRICATTPNLPTYIFKSTDSLVK
eukprot:scaffold3670_cov124-Cylindrotheca_fusiformis.AAC.30